MTAKDARGWGNRGGGGGGAVYFFGFIGAVIFYIQQADGFWSGVLGVLKAFVSVSYTHLRAHETKEPPCGSDRSASRCLPWRRP